MDLDGACKTFNLCIPFETTDLGLFDTPQSWSYRGTRFALTHVVDFINLGLALGQRAHLYNQDKILLEFLPKFPIPGLPYKTCDYIPRRTIRPQVGRQIRDILSFRIGTATSGTLSHRRSDKSDKSIPLQYLPIIGFEFPVMREDSEFHGVNRGGVSCPCPR